MQIPSKCALPLLLLCACAAPAQEVLYFPPVAYAGETATFVVGGASGQTARVRSAASLLAETALTQPRAELFAALPDAGVLAVEIGDHVHTFTLVPPGATVTWTSRDGFLYADDRPAILTPRHRHPPKHDRRWETITFFTDLVGDPRPVVGTPTLLGPAELLAVAPADWRRADLPATPATDFPLHDLVRAAPTCSNAAAVIVAPSADDLAAAMPPLDFTMTLEWLMQDLAARGARHLLVATPAAPDHRRGALAPMLPRYRLAVRSHAATYLPLHGARLGDPRDPAAWMTALQGAAEQSVRWTE